MNFKKIWEAGKFYEIDTCSAWVPIRQNGAYKRNVLTITKRINIPITREIPKTKE